MGRLDIILLVMLLVHVLVVWRLWRDGVAASLAAGWFVSSVVLLVTVFYDITFEPSGDGRGYVEYHSYQVWSHEEALSNMVARWRYRWLHAYLPWLGTWEAGLLASVILSKEGIGVGSLKRYQYARGITISYGNT